MMSNHILQKPTKTLLAKRYYSGFPLAHDTYNAISAASDGNIYYVLCSEDHQIAGKVCSFDPSTNQCIILGDLDEICGEKEIKAITQGKSHVEFMEKDGVLYFATHVGHYEMIDNMERLPVHPKDNYQHYLGGHFISYDLNSGIFTDLGLAIKDEGILTMTLDVERNQIYAISWPNGHFLHFDRIANKVLDLGPISKKGEAGNLGDDYRVLCRSMVVAPKSGHVYFTNSEGDIFYYTPNEKSIQKRTDVHMRLDYFGIYDPNQAGSMAYNWRKIFWHPTENVAYGIHGNSGYLFRFDPEKSNIELIDRLTSSASKKYGVYDQFSYGYLGFSHEPKSNTIYYLTGGPILKDDGSLERGECIPRGGAKGPENLHLITYNLNTNHYTDHGAIFYEDGSRPSFVNSLAVGSDHHLYTLARMDHEGKTIADLVQIKNPLSQ